MLKSKGSKYLIVAVVIVGIVLVGKNIFFGKDKEASSAAVSNSGEGVVKTAEASEMSVKVTEANMSVISSFF